MSVKTNKILVAGSTNIDMVVNTAKFPAPGETVLGKTFLMNAGGKGANQAVAAARLGGDVIFLGKTGKDIFGEQMSLNLKKEKINIKYLKTEAEQPSGIALITVNKAGENTIVVAPGANATLSPGDIHNVLHELDNTKIILMQLETPLETVKYLASAGKLKEKIIILNPAPAQPLPDSLLRNISVITPNKREAEYLTGLKVNNSESMERAADILLNKGVEAVIITLGDEGAFLYAGKEKQKIPAPKVKAVDTTAAGDTFNGALAVMLAEGKTLKEAVIFANKAAALSVRKAGAQRSIPYRKDIEKIDEFTH